MATVKLRVEVNPNAETENIDGIINDKTVSNIANISFKTNLDGEYINLPTEYKSALNTLFWGENDYLVFNTNDEVDNLPNSGAFVGDEDLPIQFVWGLVPQNKEYDVKLTIVGEENNLKDIVIYGDKENDQFPTMAIVDGDTDNPIYSDDYKWTINLGTESLSHTIEFKKWNRANYNALLSLIRVTLRYYEIDNFNGLNDVESLSQQTAQPKEIFYGVTPNSANAKITDIDGELKDMVTDGVIPNSNTPIELWFKETKKQQHISTDTDYTVDSVFSLTASNDFENWDKIQFQGRAYNGSANLYVILVDVLSSTLGLQETDIQGMLTDTIIVGNATDGENELSIENYLKAITVGYDYLEPDTLRATIDKICTVAQLNVYATDNGNIKFVSARPRKIANAQTLRLPIYMQLSMPQKDIILKNKYDGVEISEIKVSDLIEYNANVYSYKKNELSETSFDESEFDNQLATGSTSTVYTTPYAYASSKSYYIILDVSIPKKDNYNLKQIMEMLSGVDAGGNPYIDFFLDYYIYNGTAYSNAIAGDKEDIKNNMVLTYNENYQTGTGKLSLGEYSYYFGSSGTIYEATARATLTNKSNNKTATYDTEDDNYYKITLKLLIGKENIGVGHWASRTDIRVPFEGVCKKYVPKNLSITFKGQQRLINFDTKESVNTGDIENAKTVANIQTNTLLQSGTTYDGTKISTIIKDNILEDYKDGIATAMVETNCLDVYDTEDTKIRDFEIGETFEVGDIVKVEKNLDGESEYKYKNNADMLFKITGRKAKYSGVPLLDLELQEIK